MDASANKREWKYVSFTTNPDCLKTKIIHHNVNNKRRKILSERS